MSSGTGFSAGAMLDEGFGMSSPDLDSISSIGSWSGCSSELLAGLDSEFLASISVSIDVF